MPINLFNIVKQGEAAAIKQKTHYLMDEMMDRMNCYYTLLQNTKLVKRLKQHQIASYLGVTPTQPSRIRKVLDS